MKFSGKISVIGAGAVGTACALEMAKLELGRIILLDIDAGVSAGRALDLGQSGPICGFSPSVIGSGDFADTADSQIVIITAGSPRKPGMSREDLFAVNSTVIRSVVSEVARFSPQAILILVTNPLDVMCCLAKDVSGFPRERVFGQAGALDSARLRYFIGEAVGVSPLDVSAITLGGHGDTMLPLAQYATVGGIPVNQLLPSKKLAEIVERTARGGAEIVNCLKTGSASLAPGAAAAHMARSVLRDLKRVYPCSAWLEGEYGCRDVFMGVPVVLGARGIEKIIEVKLDSSERDSFLASAEAVKRGMERLKQG